MTWLTHPKNVTMATVKPIVTERDLASEEEKREFNEAAKLVFPDIAAYDQAAAECRDIQIERRPQYGNHLEKPRQYAIDGLYLKAVRLCKDHEAGKEFKTDTLRDFVNFALMVLTQKED